MLATFQSIFRKRAPQSVRQLYIALLAASRNPFFYTGLGVPDTIDGRFELIVLHLFLLQDRLKGNVEVSRYLGEVFLEDMDRSLRELSVADSGVLHRIKKMGWAYHGALQAYATADDEQFKAALARNLYGTVAEGDVAYLATVTHYARRAQQQLAALDDAAILSGGYQWPDVASL